MEPRRDGRTRRDGGARGREWAARLGLVCAGLLAGVVLLEVGLQTAAAVVRLGRDEATGWLTGHRRIVCLGDSNTYGVWLRDRAQQAYPSQLEALWNARAASPIEVLNAGYPGTNTSQLLRRFPQLVETLEPDLVIVLVGVNDLWTEAVAPEPGDSAGARSWLREHSRAYRLYRLVRRRIEPIDLEVVTDEAVRAERGAGAIRYGGEEIPMRWERARSPKREPWRTIAPNLRELIARAEALGVGLVLMTYPASHQVYGTANREIRVAAEQGGARLIDLEAAFRPLCPDADCPEWLHPDHHPRAAGHRRMAELVIEALETGP